jgi:hypothetical protein
MMPTSQDIECLYCYKAFRSLDAHLGHDSNPPCEGCHHDAQRMQPLPLLLPPLPALHNSNTLGIDDAPSEYVALFGSARFDGMPFVDMGSEDARSAHRDAATRSREDGPPGLCSKEENEYPNEAYTEAVFADGRLGDGRSSYNDREDGGYARIWDEASAGVFTSIALVLRTGQNGHCSRGTITGDWAWESQVCWQPSLPIS